MTAAAPAAAAHDRPPLLRPRRGVVGGVSVALARHLGWPLAAVRWLFVGTSFLAGGGALLYVWLWATVPVEAEPGTPPSGESVSGWLLRPWQNYLERRTQRAREEQRAEIAAHLHDSVLQTLALIQNRAGASSEVARIARAQERELREWLYAGAGSADSDLSTDLRDFAAALELDYPARIEVVAVGTTPERASGELAAAAREAMLNAARHAGGEISVYIEAAGDTVDVFVRDRGPGFSLDAVPDDRLGVRESIVGRMRRAGGSAAVGPGAGGVGTEVHLHLERRDG